MVRTGADVDELGRLKAIFSEQSGALARVRQTIASNLNSTYWEGPARERFARSWDRAQATLDALEQGLLDAGDEAARVARNFRQAGG